MRKEWFAFVKATREKITRKRKRADGKNYKPCTHREAMAIASQSWAKEKAKLIKRRKKEAKVTPLKPKPESDSITKDD